MVRNTQASRRNGKLAAVVALAFGVAGLQPAAHAQSGKEAIYNFLKEVACSQLPFGTCDALDPENAQNIARTHKTLLVNRYCGTGYIHGAQQLLDMGEALEPENCRKALAIR